jgi:hypothetical protein
MATYVKRTLEIHFDSDKLVFGDSSTRLGAQRSNEQYDAFIKALGYMVFYGMTSSMTDSTVNGGINVGKDMTDVEICFTYRDADAPAEKQGFTMAAVAREDGTKYTTHS